jgi:hypothetical protein
MPEVQAARAHRAATLSTIQAFPQGCRRDKPNETLPYTGKRGRKKPEWRRALILFEIYRGNIPGNQTAKIKLRDDSPELPG